MMVMRWSGIVRMERIVVMTAWELGNNTLNYLASADPAQIAATFIICTDGLEIQSYSSHSHNPAFYADSHFSPSPAPRGYQGPQSEAPHGHLLKLSTKFRG